TRAPASTHALRLFMALSSAHPEPPPAPARRDAQRFARVMEVFEQAADTTPTRRPELLDFLCRSDHALRVEVEAMLAHLGQPALATGAGLDPAFVARGFGQADPGAPTPVPIPVLTGNYRIIKMIGEGGMGVVYLAEQALPRRHVALKAMRTGVT